jgi:hypothetical protein
MSNESLRPDATTPGPLAKAAWEPMSLHFVGRVGEVTLVKTPGQPDGTGDAGSGTKP